RELLLAEALAAPRGGAFVGLVDLAHVLSRGLGCSDVMPVRDAMSVVHGRLLPLIETVSGETGCSKHPFECVVKSTFPNGGISGISAPRLEHVFDRRYIRNTASHPASRPRPDAVAVHQQED